MLLFAAKITGKECDIMTGDCTYTGVVRAVHDEWLEVETDGDVCFLNGRHIISISYEKPAQDDSRSRKGRFGRKKNEEGF